MPGLHTIIGNPNITPLKESDFSFTLHREGFKIQILSQNSGHCTALSFHEGFPFQEWEYDEIHIVLQGLIYNRSDEDIKINLTEIGNHFVSNEDYKSFVRTFVESSDGEYTVQILDKITNRFLIFNDFLGRFSLFYFFSDRLFICSPEIKTVLNFIPKIRLNQSAMVEFLMFHHPLGNKTIFNDIFQLRPSQLIVIQNTSENLSIEVSNSADFNFILTDPFKDKKESIEYLQDVFIEAVRNRVITLEKHGYRIFADISGGYDSRTVFGALSKYTKNIDYFTYSSVLDESQWAEEIFHTLGSPGRYHKFLLNTVMNDADIGSLVYITDGMINYITTTNCYNDFEYIKKNWPNKAGQFKGGGGEFIRRPFKSFFHSLVETCNAGIYSELSLDLACNIVKINPIDFKKELRLYFDGYPEKLPEDQLRRFYYEYFNRVGSAVDNRERIFFWVVNPFWSPSFLRGLFSRVPLNWVGYDYFIKFMYEVDPRLTKSPIVHSNINLQSKLNITITEIYKRLRQSIFVLLKTRIPSLLFIYNPWVKKENPNNYSKLLADFQILYNSVSFSSTVLNRDVIESNLFRNKGDAQHLFTLLIYFKEIEDRFGEKIEL